VCVCVCVCVCVHACVRACVHVRVCVLLSAILYVLIICLNSHDKNTVINITAKQRNQNAYVFEH